MDKNKEYEEILQQIYPYQPLGMPCNIYMFSLLITFTLSIHLPLEILTPWFYSEVNQLEAPEIKDKTEVNFS